LLIMTITEILVIVYGSCATDPQNDDRFGADQRRVEITLKPVLPADATTIDRRSQWLQNFLLKIGLDLKHTREWHCEFCTKPARETVWMNASWVHLSPPRSTSYVHNVCDAGTGPCAEQLRQVDVHMALMSGFPPSGPPRPRATPGETFPLSSSCATCHNETEESLQSLQRCSVCHLTCYCSVACQHGDWSRHKRCCKAVKEVKWYWT